MGTNAAQQGNPTYGGVPLLVSPVSGGATVQLGTPGLGGVPNFDFESQKATYVATTASMALHATPNDIFQIAGAANVVTRIKRIRIFGLSTVSGHLNLSLIRRSTGSTGGTSGSFTGTFYDSADNHTCSTTFTAWTVDPTTTGTTVANICNFVQAFDSASVFGNQTVLEFGNDNLKSIVLRGALDFLVLNGNGSTLSNADDKITFNVEFTEEASGT